MAKTTFSGSNEFEKQVHDNFPTIHFSRIQLNEKRKVYMVNPALGIVIVFNYATQEATYYRLNTPKELSAETLGKLFAHYANTDNKEMESVIREFIHYQKGIAFLEPQAYVDIVELGFSEKDLKETFPMLNMLNTRVSYDKESENFNRAIPASETFSGEYFDALFERKAKAAEKEQEEDEETPAIIVGQVCIIGCNAVPQIINFGLFIF